MGGKWGSSAAARRHTLQDQECWAAVVLLLGEAEGYRSVRLQQRERCSHSVACGLGLGLRPASLGRPPLFDVRPHYSFHGTESLAARPGLGDIHCCGAKCYFIKPIQGGPLESWVVVRAAKNFLYAYGA